MRPAARLYVTVVILSGLAVLLRGLAPWHAEDPTRFLCYVAMTLLASGLKVYLPGITGTMSVNFLFILMGITQLSLGETLAIGCLGSLTQCLWRSRTRAKAIQIIFSVCNMAIAVLVPFALYHWPLAQVLNHNSPVLLGLASVLFFFLNTAPIACVVSLTEQKPLARTWKACYFWSFPFYLVGACIAWLLWIIGNALHWQGSVLLLPVMYFIYRSYRIYLQRLEAEKRHVEEIAGLHLRTIEALALAIEAKDHTTHEHLCRVRTYAVEIGRELGLSEAELEALRAAALLHDIGKLAVPEHIISKPGRLTPEEFEKMKIHPIVGAEILERVNFPYPVVPIVRAHHEKWDGTGYPFGLKGEQIPIGARILAAVDLMDALASDRQYRRALPLDEVLQRVSEMAGSALDPRVVQVLKRRYCELEALARSQQSAGPGLSTEIRVTRGLAPDAGFAEGPAASLNQHDFLTSIAAARQEAQLLFELTQDVGTSLSLDDTLSMVAVRLQHMVPYDTIAFYLCHSDRLAPAYVTGENFRLFSSRELTVGEGLSGWVARNRKPILNGDPVLDFQDPAIPAREIALRSSLVVPLEGVNGLVGVLSLYRAEANAFSQDHLRILLAISTKVALSMENALKFRQAEDSAITDYLTGLPNARSLFLRLDAELARSKREQTPLAVLVCDLNGFKEINDRFGHLEGNKLLRDVAAALGANCREYDYVARMGGDEFVLILPGSQRSRIQCRIAEIRSLAAAIRPLEHGGSALSMSVGAAYYPEDGADAEQLLAEADRRMYKTKQEHKLRSVLLMPPEAADAPAAPTIQ